MHIFRGLSCSIVYNFDHLKLATPIAGKNFKSFPYVQRDLRRNCIHMGTTTTALIDVAIFAT